MLFDKINCFLYDSEIQKSLALTLFPYLKKSGLLSCTSRFTSVMFGTFDSSSIFFLYLQFYIIVGKLEY